MSRTGLQAIKKWRTVVAEVIGILNVTVTLIVEFHSDYLVLNIMVNNHLSRFFSWHRQDVFRKFRIYLPPSALRTAMSSAAMLTAISSAVLLSMRMPMGA